MEVIEAVRLHQPIQAAGVARHCGISASQARTRLLRLAGQGSIHRGDKGLWRTVDTLPPYIGLPVAPPADATGIMLAERGSRYGPFTGHAALTQTLKDSMYAAPGWHRLEPYQREALDMVQHKIGRILNGDPRYLDSWDDIIGYVRLVVEELERQGVTR